MKRKDPIFQDKPIPLRLSAKLLASIDEIAAWMEEPRSTVMRLLIRFGLENIRNIRSTGAGPAALTAIVSKYPPHDEPISLAAEAPAPEYKTKKRNAQEFPEKKK